MIETNVTNARIRMGPLRTMRAPVKTNSAIDPSLLALIRLAEWVATPIAAMTARTTAATSMLRHGRRHQRFQANAQAATVGTHITDASQHR
jgi:hypothetical protein